MYEPIYHVDAFTDQPFRGNPAAVCLVAEGRSDSWMQNIAREMNLSETAFLYRENDGYRLRWFTPSVEVELCGHATLASAHVLWERGAVTNDRPISFFTRSGVLRASLRGKQIELDFPLIPQIECEPPAGLVEALGAQPVYIGRSRKDVLVEVESEAVVRGLRPNIARLLTVPVRGVMVTAASDSPEFDFVSRFFVPHDGIDEDPVTGSAHCCLAGFWAKRLGKTELKALQASARGGKLGVRVEGDRVRLLGEAVTTIRGELLI